MTQQTIERRLPPQLIPVVADVVECSVEKVVAGTDPWQAVDDLVDAARWNPALLMAAAQAVSDVVDSDTDERYEVALDYLRAAEVRLRKRAY